jgi:CheY-like chemotaxis protein
VPRILVADDNTNIQKMVSLAFEERGVDVVAVGNGEAAVRRIPDANPDLVLADVFMPVRNGYEVCEFIKKDTRFAHVPVILLVGAFDPLDEKEARRVGADGVLKKPFVPPDPLIAMVMSALEKNPKVAAELAKARETPKEPPPPPVMEIPAKAEPKPLPDFPEPSPEEAAAIYGFGKGVRSLDDETQEERQRGLKAPAPKAKDEEDEDDFDGSSTATDWRRTGGMDFDIPANTAVDPAYSYGKDLAPITFPSEKEVPPKRIRVRDDELGEPAAPPVPLAPLGQQLAPDPAEALRAKAHEQEETQSFAPYGMKLSTDSPAAGDVPAAWHESAAFQSAVNQSPAQEEEPATPPPPAKEIKSSAVEEMKTSASALAAVSSKPAASIPWTDLDAPPSEYPAGSWMAESHSAPSAPSARTAPAVPVAPSAPVTPIRITDGAKDHEEQPASSTPTWHSAPAWQSAPAPSTPAAASSPAQSQSHSQREESRPRKKSWFADAIEAVREVVQGGSTEAPAEPVVSHSSEPPAPLQIVVQAAQSTPEPSAPSYVEPIATAKFQPVAPSNFESVAPAVVDPAASVSADSNPDWRKDSDADWRSDSRADWKADSKPDSKAESPADSKVEPVSHPDPQLQMVPADVTPSRRDPALEVPPPAHVRPEPLLVRDEKPSFSAYEERQEPTAPLQSFPLPGTFEPANGEPAADLTMTSHEEVPAFVGSHEEPATTEAITEAVNQTIAQTGSETTPEIFEQPHADFGERIPTAPPPNREALADIPFLMPPAAALEVVNSPAAPTPQANVDDLVQKVLERLEPQLHELLSKNLLKPLVENMLQSELAKKDK